MILSSTRAAALSWDSGLGAGPSTCCESPQARAPSALIARPPRTPNLALCRLPSRLLLSRSALVPAASALVAAGSAAALLASSPSARAASTRTPTGTGSRKPGRTMATSAPAADVEPSFAAQFPELPSLASLREMAGPPAVPDRLAHTKERRFGEPDSEPELLLYRDNSSWCPYCERVWLQLEEKQIPYRVEKINMRCYGPKPAWFMKMVPSGLLPVIEFKGNIVTESLDIMLLIEEAYPDKNPLLPQDAPGRKRVQELLRLERQLAGAWMQWAGAPPPGAGRWFGGGRSMGDPKDGFEAVMVDVDQAIAQSGGPFFMGEKFSFADAVYAPFLERAAASVPFWKGLQVRGNPKWPRVNAWMDAMDAKPFYKAMKSDDFTITHTLEPQIGPCTNLPEGAAYRALIEGKDRGWDLPLRPEDTAWGHDDGTGGGGVKEEAAQALVENHAAVVGFAMRALGRKPVDAPEEAAQVSAGFRHVAHALLQGVDAAGPPPKGLDPQTVATAAAYLRDRVGVPRDLRYPAARQLRAHLQWLVRSLGSEL